jgi:Ca2+:H+ antiporter
MIVKEKTLLAAILIAALFYFVEHTVLHAGQAASWAAFAVLFAAIVAASMRVAAHAEVLAHRLGEPYGTMILTFSAVVVEVLMLVIIMMNSDAPTLARDTVYAAVMIDINGILGLAALIGGIRHGEQKYNLDSSNAYIAMLFAAIGIAMFVPEFIPAQSWQAYSVFTVLIILVLYIAFLRIQTVEHRGFFEYHYGDEEADEAHGGSSTLYHVMALVFSVVMIGILAEFLAVFMEEGMRGSALPLAIPAVMVAVVSASPEILTALRAALADRMQTVINIALGASLATVLLTIPVIEGVALLTGQRIEMALTPLQTAMTTLTLLAALINLHDGQTNVLEGMVHFALFMTFVALVFLA